MDDPETLASKVEASEVLVHVISFILGFLVR